MKARRAFFVSVVALALWSMAFWWFHRPKPAIYQGKTAAEWFRVFSDMRSKNQRAVRLANGKVVYFYSGWREETTPSAEGLRRLGTNAAVYLGHRIDRGLSPWVQGYALAYQKLPPSFSGLLPKPPPPEEDAISAALILLGPDAAPALPSLIRALSRGTAFQQQIYVGALSRLEYRRNEIEPILQTLVSRGELSNAVMVVSALHIHTPVAAQVLTQAMSGVASPVQAAAWSEAADFGHQVAILLPVINSALSGTAGGARMEALQVLRAFGPDAVSATPALLGCLKEDDADLRYETARVFEAMGTNALPALPALCQATNDPSVMVRRCSARVVSNLTDSARR